MNWHLNRELARDLALYLNTQPSAKHVKGWYNRTAPGRKDLRLRLTLGVTVLLGAALPVLDTLLSAAPTRSIAESLLLGVPVGLLPCWALLSLFDTTFQTAAARRKWTMPLRDVSGGCEEFVELVKERPDLVLANGRELVSGDLVYAKVALELERQQAAEVAQAEACAAAHSHVRPG